MQALQQLARAAPAVVESLAALRLRLEQTGQCLDGSDHGRQRVGESGPCGELRQCMTRRFERQRQSQVAHILLQAAAQARQVETVAGRRQPFALRVTSEFEELRGRYAFTEEQAGDLGQLVGLIEDHRVARRQEFCRTLVAQHHVGEEEVMVDHHHVCRQRLTAGGEDEAFLVLRTFLAQAIVARRGDQRPHRRILGNVDTFGLVAAARRAGKTGDALRPGGVLAREEAAIGERAREMMVAEVVGAPLEQGHLDRQTERLADRRNVARKELVLQVSRPRGHDHLAAGKQRGNEVGIGLAGTGTGFGDEHAVARHGGGDAFGEFELLRPRAITGNRRGKRPGGGKDFGKQGGH
ncbi:MAG: hypothetical protein FAZ92_02649 [Accumulibacter sp.]|nr:MAG: hypothetical protein FAZ92_02649 [Accumulibacter sp.]